MFFFEGGEGEYHGLLFYCLRRRGPGEAYLKSLLSGPITKLVEEDINLEINPLKVTGMVML